LLQEELKESGVFDSTISLETEKLTNPNPNPNLKKRKNQSSSTKIPTKAASTSIPFESKHSRLRQDGSSTLLWLLLSTALQRRFEDLASKDPRSSHSLYEAFGTQEEEVKNSNLRDHLGRDIQPPRKRGLKNNVNVLNVCEGFERNRDIISYLVPGGKSEEMDLDDDDDGEDVGKGLGKVDEESEEETKVSGIEEEVEETVSNPNIKLKEAIDPRFKQQSQSIPKSKSKSNFITPSTSSQISTFRSISLHLLLFILYPLIWLFSKSPSEATQSLVWAIVSPISDSSQGNLLNAGIPLSSNDRDRDETQVNPEKELKKKIMGIKIVPGELYREGKIVA